MLRLQMQAMVLPDLNAGVMYHKHDGVLQESNGQILNVDLQSLYAGGGDRTFASQTVLIPAIHFYAHVGDAFFAPLAAAQVVNSRTPIPAASPTRCCSMSRAATWISLRRNPSGSLWGCRRVRSAQCSSATAAFAQSGQGRLGDYHRARAATLLLRARVEGAEESVAAAAAALGAAIASRSVHPTDNRPRHRPASSSLSIIPIDWKN